MTNTLTIGLCRNRDEEASLLAGHIPAAMIYMIGRGAETFDQAWRKFRGRRGTLAIACDMRIFGGTCREVSTTSARLEHAGIKVVDITHPEDTTFSALVDRARIAITANRFHDKRRAKRSGARGGVARGQAAAIKRAAIMSDDIVRRLCAHPKLTWRDRAEILGPPFSMSGLRRNYTT